MPGGVPPQLGTDLPLISVQIAPNGEMHNATILRSSGDAAVDKSIVACAEGDTFKVLTSNGRPAEITWTLMYMASRRGMWDGFLPAILGDGSKACGANYPQAALRKRAEGDTLLSYRIGFDGNTKDFKVLHSSGDADLDQTTIDCASQWKFYPAHENGQPVEIDWTTSVRWRSHRP